MALCISLASCEKNETPDYLNPELSIEKRVDDLVSRMTLEEKVSQMLNQAKAIPRLNIPEYDWWNECLHGVARAGNATVFPQAIALAATWDTDLMFELADVISTEARAKHHEAIRHNDFSRYKGLTFWSPNINIFRDPRWGRGQETYGEDPYLTGRMGVAFVEGLQGDDPKYFKVIATPKHFAVHSGPEPDRHHFDAVTNVRDFYDTYLPAFEACVREAGAYSVMCAYNRYMGDACCGSPRLMQDILRNEWGFKGYIVSDCGAVRDIYENHKVKKTAPEAAALAVKSGTDLNCGSAYNPALLEAVEEGLITEDDIDVSVKRLFTARFKLGMFDPPEMVTYAQIPYSENDTEAHRQLSLRVARESIVLLKNADNQLPLKKGLKNIAVIGPTADSYEMLLGNYNGTPSKYVTPLQGIKNKVSSETEVVFEQGCNLAKDGAITHALNSRMLNSNGEKGLKLECFKNTDKPGMPDKPFFTKVDDIPRAENWVSGAGVPGLSWESEIALRWSGTIKVPETGDYNLTVKGNDNYRLVLDDTILVEDLNNVGGSTKSNHVHLEKDKAYDLKLEYFKKQGWPSLTVEWEFLNFDHFGRAIELATDADAVIYVGGLTAQLEGEEMRVDYEGFKGGDRTNIKLPKVQMDLLKALYSTGKPVVLVLTSGSALAVNWANQNIPAIVQLWYPGEEGGTALADVLFGDYNPAGRLPVTFYKSVDQLPPFEDYNMNGRTYRYFEDDPLYAFGYGLSYTTFSYTDLTVSEKVQAGDTIAVSLRVKNAGAVAGDEVVQLYVKDKEASVPVPIRSLQGLTRIHLEPGEKKEVMFTLTPKNLSLVTDEGKRLVEPGVFEISVGGGLPGSVPATTAVVSQNLEVEGEPLFLN
jgi:beta-glucosidase